MDTHHNPAAPVATALRYASIMLSALFFLARRSARVIDVWADGMPTEILGTVNIIEWLCGFHGLDLLLRCGTDNENRV